MAQEQERAEARANRLAGETSPYLLQHAHNPVNWYPWGREAFEAARERDVPILVSIGYSTCYWCHVMERECFEDEAIAQVMNEHLVCIKVDREERPDVDDVYMTAVQLLSGSGGWPLNMFVEPASLKPIWGGTYFPPEASPKYGNRPSWPQVVTSVAEAWRTDREGMLKQAEQLGEAVADQLGELQKPVRVGQEQVSQAVSMLLQMHDRANGGFGRAPKFPQPVYLELLLSFREFAGDDQTRAAVDGAVTHTLTRMALGGMFDQVGGGFHRYSVDERWLVPHFEKMLYDNGQLAEVYARGAQRYDDGLFERIARRTCEYALREMTSEEGAFYSAQDAEVNHREGQNYLWTREQLEAVLEEEDAKLAAEAYGVAAGPNFRDPHHPEDEPANVLFLSQRPAALAARLGMEEGALLERLDGINAKLLTARMKRDQPGTDDKVLAGWNGLMIGGMASTGAALGEEGVRFVEAAGRAADFVLREMRDEQKGLLRSHRKGQSKIPAFCEDYALLVRGLIALHRTGRDGTGKYLDRALALMAEAEHLFGDAETGAWYDTREGEQELFVRARSLYDGAVPCASSVMLNNLVDLHEITGERAHLQRAVSGLRAVSAFLARSPVAACNSTRALLRLLAADDEMVAAAMPEGEATAAAVPGAPPEDAVKILADRETVKIARDRAGGVVLRIQIEEGYHVNAADPGGDGLVPLRVFVAHGSGAKAYADYPAGRPYSPGWVEAGEGEAEIRVYAGTVEIPVVLERAGEWSGTPVLAVTYQVCSDEACFMPTTVELDVAIERE